MNKRVVKFTGKKMIVIGKGLLLLVLAGVLLVLLVNFHMGRVAANDAGGALMGDRGGREGTRGGRPRARGAGEAGRADEPDA